MLSFILNKFHDFFEFYTSYYYLDYNNYNEYVYLSKTDNNANALSTTNNIFLDLFVNIGRDLSYDELCDYLDKCMKINPYKTIAIIFNCRDRKNGKKEKKISNDAMKWLKNNNISLSINGEEKQSASINMMVWGIEELISILSQKVILKPGDILFTGTPAGVGNIKKGDILEASIDEVGALKLNFE